MAAGYDEAETMTSLNQEGIEEGREEGEAKGEVKGAIKKNFSAWSRKEFLQKTKLQQRPMLLLMSSESPVFCSEQVCNLSHVTARKPVI